MKEILYKIGKGKFWITYSWDAKFREWIAEFSEKGLKEFVKKLSNKEMVKLEESH